MRTSHALIAAAVLAGSALVAAGLARAGDDGKEGGMPAGMPAPQKAIHQPFLDALVGSWTTESTSKFMGQEHKGKGKVTFALAVGGTALLETYENTSDGPGGQPMTFYGHGIYKLSDDGKSASVWWLDNFSPEPMKLSGALSDHGLELSGEVPPHGKMTISMSKTADGVTFKLTDPMGEMAEAYKPAH